MTPTENERLMRVETRLDGVAEDVSEIKTTLKEMNNGRNERHADVEARLAVLEDRSGRLEKLLYGSTGLAIGGLGGHIPTIVSALS